MAIGVQRGLSALGKPRTDAANVSLVVGSRRACPRLGGGSERSRCMQNLKLRLPINYSTGQVGPEVTSC